MNSNDPNWLQTFTLFLKTAFIGLDHALKLLETCGFSTEEARRQTDRFRLNPGYQLCYSLRRMSEAN